MEHTIVDDLLTTQDSDLACPANDTVPDSTACYWHHDPTLGVDLEKLPNLRFSKKNSAAARFRPGGKL